MAVLHLRRFSAVLLARLSSGNMISLIYSIVLPGIEWGCACAWGGVRACVPAHTCMFTLNVCGNMGKPKLRRVASCLLSFLEMPLIVATFMFPSSPLLFTPRRVDVCSQPAA